MSDAVLDQRRPLWTQRCNYSIAAMAVKSKKILMKTKMSMLKSRMMKATMSVSITRVVPQRKNKRKFSHLVVKIIIIKTTVVQVLQLVKASNRLSSFMDRLACLTKSQKKTIMGGESSQTILRMRERMLRGTSRNFDSRFKI